MAARILLHGNKVIRLRGVIQTLHGKTSSVNSTLTVTDSDHFLDR